MKKLILCIFLILLACSKDSPTPDTPTVTYTLSVSASDGGNVDPSSGTHNENSTVVVTATPSTGFEFTGWSGDASGTDNPLTVTMTGNKTITATFSRIQNTFNVNKTVHSIIPKNLISSNPEEVSTILVDIPHQTIYLNRNGNEQLLIGPNDYGDVYGERPMKHFVKENGNWTFLKEYPEFQDGGPRDFESFDDGRLALASHGLEPPNRSFPLGYLWELSGVGTDDLRFNKISDYKGFWHNVAVGDLNRDNIQDVVSVQMGNSIGDLNPFHIFFGTENQTYEKVNTDDFFETNVGIRIPTAGSIAINDIDNDGNMDIILAAYASHLYDSEESHGDLYGQKFGVEIYSDTDGNGRYEKINYAIPLGTFEYTEMGASGIKIEDLNLDGNLDMVLFYEGSIDPNLKGIPPYENYIDVFLNNGERGFTVNTIFEKSQTEISGREFVLLDVDNDGDKDIALKSWQFGFDDINLDLRNPSSASASNVLNFSHLIYINNNGDFNRVGKDLTYPIENLRNSYFIPIENNNQFRYLQVAAPDEDFISISEYTFEF
ncbi:FG-GAP-like repeat-containing protein [Flavobacteriaceae bacterium]|nr:FG-GAP-like repeat-containing protein [Flavobacteriaceae bacterium]